MSSPTVVKGAAGYVLENASARVLAARVDTSVDEGAGMIHWCGDNCTDFGNAIVASLWNINAMTYVVLGGRAYIPALNDMRIPCATSVPYPT